MAKELVEQIKEYVQARNLLKQGKQVLSNSADLKEYNNGVTNAYKSGKSLDDYERDVTTLQTLQSDGSTLQNDGTRYDFESGQSIVEQFRYNKQYSTMVRDAERVFSTSSEYANWKEQIDYSYNNHLPLDTFAYALEMFEALQQAEDSALYQDEVNKLAQDSTSFNEFATLSQKIGEEYVAPSFTGTQEFNAALEATSTITSDIQLFTQPPQEVNYDVEMPKTNKAVMRVDNNVVENDEVLFDENGVRDPATLTTAKQQEDREYLFKEMIAGCETQEEVDIIVDSFEPTALQTSDREAYYGDNGEMDSHADELGNDSMEDGLIENITSNLREEIAKQPINMTMQFDTRMFVAVPPPEMAP